MLMELVLLCLGLVVEVWGQDYPPPTPAAHPPPPPVYQAHNRHYWQPHQHHQPGYATPAPATGYGASGGYGTELMTDPATMLLLMQQDDGE